jgi:ParB-like chromosome segregation protein Spo0J
MIPQSIELLPLSALRPRPSNPRHHSARQIHQIAESIKLFGWTVPIIVDANDGIIAGHGRYEAARMLDFQEVPVR